MKKRLISLILAAIVLLSCAFAEESQSEEYLLPYIDLYAVPLGDNAIFEIPNEWGYQTSDAADVPPMTSLLTDQNQMVMAMKLPADWEATDASDALGIQSFIVEGTALMLGLTTPQSTRLQEMTINDMPAVLVEMNGQGFDILWIGDSGDLYFFLFPNDDDALVQQMISVAQSLCVFHRKGEQVNPASDFAYTADGGEVTITDYIGTSEHVLIPDTIDGLPVTALAASGVLREDSDDGCRAGQRDGNRRGVFFRRQLSGQLEITRRLEETAARFAGKLYAAVRFRPAAELGEDLQQRL